MTATCFSSTTYKEIAYTQIRNEIAALQASIRACKKRHNDLNITARLPDEILADIFQWNSIIHREAVKKDFPPTIKRSWFQVSFVCSEWRRVALNCPSLWNRLDYGEGNHKFHGEWLSQVILPRSKNSLLSIQIDLGYTHLDEHTTQCEAVQIMLRHHSRRIRNLSLIFSHHCSEVGHLISQKSTIMPYLESLDIASCEIVADVLQHMAPTSGSLSLYNCPFQLQPNLPLALPIKTLSLDCVSIESFTHLVTLLKACEKLQELTLKMIFLLQVEDFDAPIKPCVVLPNLKTLTIMDYSCPERYMAAVLSTISCPVATHVNICTLEFYDISLELLHAAARFIHPVKFLSITPKNNDPEKLLFSFSGLSNVAPLCRGEHWSIPEKDLTLSIEGMADDPETFGNTFYPKLFDTFTLDRLEILEISTPLALRILRAVLGDLRSVHTINIVGDNDLDSSFNVSQALADNLVSCASLDLFNWYECVKDLWLKPQVTVMDIDAQDKELSKVQATLFEPLLNPPLFPALNRLEIPLMGGREASIFGAVLLLRHTMGMPLQEVYVDRIDDSADVRDLAIIRQSVEYLHVGSKTIPQQREVGKTEVDLDY